MTIEALAREFVAATKKRAQARSHLSALRRKWQDEGGEYFDEEECRGELGYDEMMAALKVRQDCNAEYRRAKSRLFRACPAGVTGTPAPQCAARSTAHIPGELSAIWCERCGEGTTAGGICRDRNAGVPPCHAPYCGCMNQGGPGPCAAKLAASE